MIAALCFVLQLARLSGEHDNRKNHKYRNHAGAAQNAPFLLFCETLRRILLSVKFQKPSCISEAKPL